MYRKKTRRNAIGSSSTHSTRFLAGKRVPVISSGVHGVLLFPRRILFSPLDPALCHDGSVVRGTDRVGVAAMQGAYALIARNAISNSMQEPI